MNRQEKLIAEIHAEFDTAQDRLLSQANAILSKPIDTEQTAVESIGERLAKIGFTNTPTVKKAREIKKRKIAEINKVVETRAQAELIQYYQLNYPFLKFLTETELDRICEKYNLVHNSIGNYIGDVPQKNLEDIENTQPRMNNDFPKDVVYAVINYHSWIFPNSDFIHIFTNDFWRLPRRIEGLEFRMWHEVDRYLKENYGANKSYYLCKSVKNYREDRSGLFICAPKSSFKGNPLNLSFYEVKDPIVFRYVRGGIQVLTKWGLEANDPDLVVPKLN